METHKCKLCTRTFANGRALGGHMKAHLATLPLPPKTQQLGDRTESASISSSSSVEEQEQDDKSRELTEEKTFLVGYGLRENPKKSFRFADPEFSFTADSGCVVQDRESETESRNPTKRRSKRNWKMGMRQLQLPNSQVKKPKLRKPSFVDSSPTEPQPEPLSSVSDTSPEEDVARSLMMLSRDVWRRNNEDQDKQQQQQVERSVDDDDEILVDSKEIKVKSKVGGKFRCDECKKMFRSSQALGSHRRVCSQNGKFVVAADGNERIFECPFCYKVFGSGQALGGHKRSHLLASSSSTTTIAATATTAAISSKLENNNFIDLNLPAPSEDDEFSVVSEA